MALEPFLVFAWRNGTSTYTRRSTQSFPNCFRQSFRKTVWREQYLAHAALRGFPQGSFLLFYQLQFAPVFFEFEQFFLERGDMTVRSFQLRVTDLK